MESLLHTFSKPLLLLLLLAIISSCKKEDNPVGPSATDWEGNAPSFNEAYRDSLVTIENHGILFLSKDGTIGRFIGGFSQSPVFVSWTPRKWKLLYAPTHVYGPPYGHLLYFINPDGTGQQAITKSPECIIHAMMSPDGQKIAYVSIDTTDTWRNKGWIKVMNPDGTGMVTLTSRIIGPSKVTWTPDSRQVVYTDGDGAQSRINIVSIDGTGQRILHANTFSTCDEPSLSPDGSQLAFCTTYASVVPYKVHLLDMTTLQDRSLTTGTVREVSPTWSTDGRQIVFCSDSGSVSRLWRVNSDGQNPVCIKQVLQNNRALPSWYK